MGLTQITTVKGRLEHVQANLKRWLATDIDQLVIVDYACPEKTGEKIFEWTDDPRVNVLQIGAKTAGPFYNHGRARNFGAQAARHDLLLFLDADSWMRSIAIETMKDQLQSKDHGQGQKDISTPYPRVPPRPEYFEKLPYSWTLDGQIAVRNALFFLLNGFSELCPFWGGETYDLMMRAAYKGAKIVNLPRQLGVMHDPHNDELRAQFLPNKFLPVDGREQAFEAAMTFYQEKREVSLRAQPGRRFGLTGPTKDVYLIKDGNHRVFNPCGDH